MPRGQRAILSLFEVLPRGENRGQTDGRGTNKKGKERCWEGESRRPVVGRSVDITRMESVVFRDGSD